MKISRKVIAFATSVIVGIGLALAISSPASAYVIIGPFKIRATNTNLCMDVRDVSQANGALVQLYTCLSTQYNQRFYLHNITNVPWQYNIVAAHSNKCIDVRDVSQADGAQIQQWGCLGPYQYNQIFTDIDALDHNSYLQALHSGKCISYYLPAYQQQYLTQWPCYTRWTIEAW